MLQLVNRAEDSNERLRRQKSRFSRRVNFTFRISGSEHRQSISEGKHNQKGEAEAESNELGLKHRENMHTRKKAGALQPEEQTEYRSIYTDY